MSTFKVVYSAKRMVTALNRGHLEFLFSDSEIKAKIIAISKNIRRASAIIVDKICSDEGNIIGEPFEDDDDMTINKINDFAAELCSQREGLRLEIAIRVILGIEPEQIDFFLKTPTFNEAENYIVQIFSLIEVNGSREKLTQILADDKKSRNLKVTLSRHIGQIQNMIDLFSSYTKSYDEPEEEDLQIRPPEDVIPEILIEQEKTEEIPDHTEYVDDPFEPDEQVPTEEEKKTFKPVPLEEIAKPEEHPETREEMLRRRTLEDRAKRSKLMNTLFPITYEENPDLWTKIIGYNPDLGRKNREEFMNQIKSLFRKKN
jgi:hypothetical protein